MRNLFCLFVYFAVLMPGVTVAAPPHWGAISAGTDQLVNFPSVVRLNGEVVANWVPPLPRKVQISWEKISGPGEVSFDDPTSLAAMATFSNSGVYVLELVARLQNVVFAKDQVQVVLNARPQVSAGPAQVVMLPAGVSLDGSVSDDGLPEPGQLLIQWSALSGPGPVVFSDVLSPVSSASFSKPGEYVLQLSANDGLAQSASQVIMTVKDVPPLISYQNSYFTFTKGDQVHIPAPANMGGEVVSYEIDPKLPDGLFFDASAGTVSGVAKEIQIATPYRVTALNSGGLSSALITIAINDIPPSNLTYPDDTFVYTWGIPISESAPSSDGGAVLGYSISPALPSGLVFDASSGVISGVPLQLTPATLYQVTAINSGGATSTQFSIGVMDFPMSIVLGVDDNRVTRTRIFEIPISVFAGSAVHVVVFQNGAPIVSSDEFNFVASAMLNEGVNVFEVLATNVPGTQVRAFLHNITLDTVSPDLNDLQPAEGAILNALAFPVSGRSSEPLHSISVNGIVLELSEDRMSFSGSYISTTAGPVTLLWKGADLVGNEVVVSTTIQIGTPISGGGSGGEPVGDRMPPSPMIWNGPGFSYDFNDLFPGGAGGDACAAAETVLGPMDDAVLLDENGNPTNIADPGFIEALANGESLDPVTLGYLAVCKGLNFEPSFSCEQNRKYYKILVGEYPEATVLSFLQNGVGVSGELIDFLKPRFNVCTGIDFSGIGCKEMIDLAATLSSLALPGLGQVLNSPIAKVVAEAILCADLDCSNPTIARTPVCWNLELPEVQDIDIGLSFDFGGGSACWFGCGQNGGSDSDHWFDYSVPGSGSGSSILPCSSLPADVAGVTWEDVVGMSSQAASPLSLWVDSLMACTMPSPIPGFKDLNPPIITLRSPAEGEGANGSVLVAGTVDDFSSSVTVNGMALSTTYGNAGLDFSITIQVPQDLRIEVRAVDAAGNESSVVRHLVNDGIIGGEGFLLSLGNLTPCVVRDGVAKCWGANQFGTVGDGSKLNRPIPSPVSGLSGVTSIAVHDHACAVSGGEVYCWGRNDSGQIGLGDFIDSSAPIKVESLQNVKSVAVGWDHSCAILESGGMKCWGDNAAQKLGQATPDTNSATPVSVLGVGTVDAVALGRFHSCVIESGAARCWGWNLHGELGIGYVSSSVLSPVQVLGLGSGVDQIATAEKHSCAVVNGAAKCWGDNTGGRLGAGSSENKIPQPTQVLGLESGVTSITLGSGVGCAIKGGEVYCWGGGNLATAVAGLNGRAVDVKAGRGTFCALLESGEVMCWGNNHDGSLGNYSTAISSAVPVSVFFAPEALVGSQIAVGGASACGIVSGMLKCWGGNGGQLGVGDTKNREVPTQVVGLFREVTSVSVGSGYACAVANEKAYCWGQNTSGRLGTGSFTDTSVPVQLGIMSVKAIAARITHTCAISSTGAMCWGVNNYGQLGNGSTLNTALPVSVTGLGADASAITVGLDHSCALTAAGAMCWGRNTSGQLGTGSTVGSHVPMAVSGLDFGVTEISAGRSFTCAVHNGSAKCWGSNAYGRIGNGGGETKLPVPTQVLGMESGVTSVFAGDEHACAVKEGMAWCWGQNLYGLGDGLSTQSGVPVPVVGLGSGVKSLVGSSWATCALLESNEVRCWGYNGHGVFGNGTKESSAVPSSPAIFTIF